MRNDLDAMQASEDFLRTMIDKIPTLAWSCRPDGITEFLNQRWLDYTGLSMEEALGWGWKAAIHPEDLGKLMATWLGLLASGEPGQEEARLRRFDGEYRWFLFRAVPVRDEQGTVVRWYGTNTDIEDLKRVESLLAAEKRTLEIIAGGASLIDVLENLCRTIDAQSPNTITTVLLMDPDGKRLWPAAGPRVPSGWTQAITPLEIGPCVGSCGTAAYLKEPVITSDIAGDPLWVGYQDLALSYGLRAAWSQPLISKNGDVLGTFAMYFAEPRSPSDSDLELIKRAGDMAQIAIERNRIQSALQESEERFRLIVDSIPGFISTMSPAGEVESVNQRTLDYLGMTLEEIRDWPRVLHEEDRELVINTWRRSIETGEPYDIQHRIRRTDGVFRWFHVRGLPLRDPQGHIVRWYVLIADIDDLKKAEEEIRRSEAYLAEAQNLSLTGSFGWRVASGELIWSAETFCILGYDRSVKPTLELVFKRVHPEDICFVQQTIERATRDLSDFDFEHRLLMPDGSIKHVHVVARPSKTESGEVEFVGAVMDVTGTKLAEDKLRRDERELRRITDAIPQAISVLAPDGTILHANQVVLDYTGLSLEDVKADDFRKRLFHPDDLEKFRDERPNALARGEPFEAELRARRKDGQYRWFLVRYNPLRDDEGHIIRWYATGIDIEDRKQAEERVQKENLALREEIDHSSMFEEIIGSSEALRKVLAQVAKVAPMDSTVLILGETGTGKELIARAIHKRSNRSSRAFIRVNCAAIPQPLIASELFGHEKGAFTGALQRRLGRFELADGGTIFLDEIGDLPAEAQIALLRVLQEREFERVGSSQPISADVRVLAATNRDLKTAVAAGTFRQDLFYRLNVFPIQMPSLRERVDDIPLLVEYFIERYGKTAGKKFRNLNKKTLQLFQAYDWPGNIREMQNVIERAVILCEGDTFSVDETWLRRESRQTLGPNVPFVATLVEREKEIIETALAACHGRIAGPFGAAAKLGIPRQTLESKIKSLGIDKHQFKARHAI